jgi:hypothetical protein
LSKDTGSPENRPSNDRDCGMSRWGKRGCRRYQPAGHRSLARGPVSGASPDERLRHIVYCGSRRRRRRKILVEDVYGRHEVKLPARDLIAYPSTSLHPITPVTAGNRPGERVLVQSRLELLAAKWPASGRLGRSTPLRAIAGSSLGQNCGLQASVHPASPRVLKASRPVDARPPRGMFRLRKSEVRLMRGSLR